MTFIISDAERSAKIPIELKGDMAQYAVVEPNFFKLQPGENREVKLTLDLPADISKGVHLLEISAVEQPAVAQQGAFNLMPAVGVALKIINTDVQKACSVGLFNAEMNSNKVLTILNVANNGKQALQKVYADYALYDSEGLPVTSWKTGEVSVAPFESKTVSKPQPLNDAVEGYYTVKGTLYCAGETFPLEKKVLNHADGLVINGFNVYKEDGFFLVEFDTENPYLAPVTAYGNLGFFDESGNSVRNYALNQGTVAPESTKIYRFRKKLNGLDVPAGAYTVKAGLSFEGKKVMKEGQIILTEDEVRRTENAGGGFSANYQKKARQEEAALEQQSSSISAKVIVRLLAVFAILALLLIIFKRLSR